VDWPAGVLVWMQRWLSIWCRCMSCVQFWDWPVLRFPGDRETDGVAVEVDDRWELARVKRAVADRIRGAGRASPPCEGPRALAGRG
jgi:hypothetical protein